MYYLAHVLEAGFRVARPTGGTCCTSPYPGHRTLAVETYCTPVHLSQISSKQNPTLKSKQAMSTLGFQWAYIVPFCFAL